MPSFKTVRLSVPAHWSVFVHLMESQVPADLVVRLWDEGHAPTVKEAEQALPAWLSSLGMGFSNPWTMPNVFAEPPSLAWDLGQPLEVLPVLAVEPGVRSRLWLEHLLIRLLREGISPLLPMCLPNSAKPLAPGTPPTLLDWAHNHGLTFVVKECLERLPPREVRSAVLPVAWEREHGHADRIHHALAHANPLLAQAWKNAGADPLARDSRGRTALFFASDESSLDWALEQGLSMGDKDADGKLPFECWEERMYSADMDSSAWNAMQLKARALTPQGDDHFAFLIQQACQNFSEEKVASLWESHPAPGVLPGGRTAVGVVGEALFSLGLRDSLSRTYANHLVAFLAKRTDWEAASLASKDGLSDLKVLGLAFAQSPHEFKKARIALAAVEKKEKRFLLPVPSPVEALKWAAASEKASPNGRRLAYEWAVEKESKAAKEQHLLHHPGPRPVELLEKEAAFAQAWVQAIEQTRQAYPEEVKHFNMLVNEMLEHACRALFECSQVPLLQERFTPVWTDVLMVIAETLTANGLFLTGDETFEGAFDYQVSLGQSDATTSAIASLLHLGQQSPFSHSEVFWRRFSAMAEQHVAHDDLHKLVRARVMHIGLPKASDLAPARPRF